MKLHAVFLNLIENLPLKLPLESVTLLVRVIFCNKSSFNTRNGQNSANQKKTLQENPEFKRKSNQNGMYKFIGFGQLFNKV